MPCLPKIRSSLEDDINDQDVDHYGKDDIDQIVFCPQWQQVVMVPAPAILGKAKGTIEATSRASSLNKVMPKIISKAKKKITKEPATAKELTSIPIRARIFSHKKRKAIMMKAATKEALSDGICPAFSLKLITMGILPIMSMTAKSTILAGKISFKSISIICSKVMPFCYIVFYIILNLKIF